MHSQNVIERFRYLSVRTWAGASALRRNQVLDDVAAHVIPPAVGVPLKLRQQALHAVRRGAIGVLGGCPVLVRQLGQHEFPRPLRGPATETPVGRGHQRAVDLAQGSDRASQHPGIPDTDVPRRPARQPPRRSGSTAGVQGQRLGSLTHGSERSRFAPPSPCASPEVFTFHGGSMRSRTQSLAGFSAKRPVAKRP